MESMIELCDLIAQNPSQFADKLAWICGRCPPIDSSFVSDSIASYDFLSYMNKASELSSDFAMAVAEYTVEIVMSAVNNVSGDLGFTEELDSTTPEASSSFLGRFRILLPNLFCHSRLEAIQSFDFLSYVSEASELSSDFAMAVAEYTGEIVMSAINNAGGDLGVSLSQNFHPILLSNANRLVSTLLDRFEISVPSSPRELVSITPEASSPQCLPLSANHYQSNERNSPGNEVSNASGSSSGDPSRVTDEATSALWSKGLVMKGGSLAWKSNVDIFGADIGFNDEGRGGSATYKRVVASFEEEPVESLQQQEIAFKLIGHILDKVQIDLKLL
ncbi:unnamed protein product [Ilex paraguariensis]|uniref:Uncharacterized protein n=1 Tax=Ilex paraguariensis TaxID=185542 RepID=A0ABC8U0S2_9AQUA